MKTIIKPALPEDITFLLQLERSVFPEYKQSSVNSIKRSLVSDNQEVHIISIIRKNNIIPAGALVLHLHKNAIRIFSVAVSNDFQKNNLGSKLVQFAIEHARDLDKKHILLEAEENNQLLVSWYEKFGFKIIGRIDNYYKENGHAVKMELQLVSGPRKNSKINVLVVDNQKNFNCQIEGVQVVSARNYISAKKYQELKNARIFNLCSSFKYQSTGYYVSLLASARDHRVVPSVATIGDFKNKLVVRSLSSEVEELIQKTFSPLEEKQLTIDVIFGYTNEPKYRQLSFKLYMLFETPLLRVQFIKNGSWGIAAVKPLVYSRFNEDEKLFLEEAMQNFFSKKRFKNAKLKNYKYDLAILVNKEDECPPSNKRALKKFKEAALRAGFYAEFITKEDINRINEFDALFIRETTNVNNHTYRFSRIAYAEALAVMDDPWSILRCSNKIYLHERMIMNNIPVPDTRILAKKGYSMSQMADFQFPVILKQPDGSFSKGVTKATTLEEMDEKLKVLFKTSELILAQQFLPSDFDWRIGILDGQPIFACRYYMARGHWQIYNWSGSKSQREGLVDTVNIEEVPRVILDAALKGAQLMGDGLYGVDIKEIDGKAYLIEINDNPNIDAGIEDKILKDKLYDKIMGSLIRRIELSRNLNRYIAADPV